MLCGEKGRRKSFSLRREKRKTELASRAEKVLAEKQGSQTSYYSKLRNKTLHYHFLYYVQTEKWGYMVTDIYKSMKKIFSKRLALWHMLYYL